MADPWYKTRPGDLEVLRKEVEELYPDLRLEDRGSAVVLSGYYPLSEGGRVWDRYHVEVALPKDSPRHLPQVREINGRIPHEADRHVFTDTKTACVVLPDAFWYEFPDGLSLLEFVNGPLRSYLANQSLIEQGHDDVWANGEWSHGAAGIYEFYRGILGAVDPVQVAEFLRLVNLETVKGHWQCPCGSQKRLRNCHGPVVRDLQGRIPRDVTEGSQRLLADAISKLVDNGATASAKGKSRSRVS